MTANSRQSKAGAGWDCAAGRYQELMEEAEVPPRSAFSWLNPKPLWQSRNDRVARLFGDPIDDLRREWMKILAPDSQLVDRSAESPISFLVLGDTGEGDASQWVTVPPLEACAEGTAFAFICSDVIYPSDRPKILLSGKPLRVDGKKRTGPIEGDKLATVDAIVRDQAHHYIAAIGGDIHNYQRYLERDRRFLYLVVGGSGAFMHQTHSLDNMDDAEAGVKEENFRCYPLRGDSLSRYSVLYGRKVRWLGLRRFMEIDANVAARIIGDKIGVEPTRPEARNARVTWRAKIAARILFFLPGRGRRSLHLPFSEWLDFNAPPMFKSFLRVDVSDGEIRIRCFGVTGCADQQDDPPVEDQLVATVQDGRWTWTVVEPAS